jgi:hypothetical protein
MSDHSIQPLPAVAAYAATLRSHGIEVEVCPVVLQTFRTTKGWQPHTGKKRISRAYAERLRKEGFTSVALEVRRGGSADFRLRELLRREPTAMKSHGGGTR